ncbi:MAG: hypothetical protein M1438_19195 [Deltaproteobacteria bacterium]|nr:hypothetical protein [Deltaproteobacteria bacterium]
MLEALWSAEFVSNLQSFGAGVVIFETNRIFGGDSAYYYLGSCNVENQILNADIEVIHYAGQPFSIFGPLKKFHLKLSGKVQDNFMELQGYLKKIHKWLWRLN